MKDLLLATAIVTLSLGVVAVLVFGLNDDETFVSPPEIAAEEFVRAVVLGRVEPARGRLASSEKRVTSVEHLLRVSRDARRRYGTVDDVRAKKAERMDDRVIATVLVTGSRREEEVQIPMVREWGEWKVGFPFGLLPSAQSPPSR